MAAYFSRFLFKSQRVRLGFFEIDAAFETSAPRAGPRSGRLAVQVSRLTDATRGGVLTTWPVWSFSSVCSSALICSATGISRWWPNTGSRWTAGGICPGWTWSAGTGVGRTSGISVRTRDNGENTREISGQRSKTRTASGRVPRERSKIAPSRTASCGTPVLWCSASRSLRISPLRPIALVPARTSGKKNRTVRVTE